MRVLIGDIFESELQTIVNTVNCVGVMGKGVALEFKKRFPDMFEDYEALCRAKKVRLGEPYLYRRLTPPWILNYPTKDHWRSVSRLDDIISGLEYLVTHYREWGITSLAVPPLGCGHGQLEWRVVGPTLYRHLNVLDIPVELYAPFGTVKTELRNTFLANPIHVTGATVGPTCTSKLCAAEMALVEILARIEKEPFHWPVGRTTFQKLAYFATECGLKTGLRYSRGSYGPFTSDLKPMITRLVNNGLIREERLGRMFAIKTGPTYVDAARAFSVDLERWNDTIERVVDLLLRTRTKDAEIAATVHFAAHSLYEKENSNASEMDVLIEVQRWKQKRKPPLKDEDIARSIRNLNILGWINSKPSEDLPLPEEVLADV